VKGVNPLVRFSVERYVLALGLFAAVLLFGYLATRSLGVDLLPSVNVPTVVVSVQYPGASPATVDRQVTQLLENALSRLGGIAQLSSTSSLGQSRVVVSFSPGTDPRQAASQVAAQVAALRGLPSGVSTPTVQTFDPNAQPILEFGLYAPGKPLEEVYRYAEDQLLPLLEQVSGVANVALTGGPEKGVDIFLDPSRLAFFGLSVQQVSQAVAGAALQSPIGSLTRSGTTLSLSTRTVPKSAEDVAAILVDPQRGIRVGDLGQVQVRNEVESYVRVNGQPAVLVSLQQASGSNALAVADGVRRLLQDLRLPEGYQVVFSNDTTLVIRAAVERTYKELFLTAGVVAAVVLLFLGRLNTAFTVILAIPISLAAAPILYSLLGFTFNLVSLLALIVAIGIVVDDSIVVAENVERYRAQGLGQMEAVLKGASEVFSAVAAASLSVLSVVIPVSFVEGFAGRYVQQFALGLAAAVAMSWLEALLFLTVRMAYTPDAPAKTWASAWREFLDLGRALRFGLTAWRRGLGLLGGLALALFLLRQGGMYLPLLLLYPFLLALGEYLVRTLLAFLEALTLILHLRTEALLEKTRAAYAQSLPWVLRHNGSVLLFSLALFLIVALAVFPRIPFSFVPRYDTGYLRAGLRLSSEASLNRTNELVARLENFFLAQPEVETVQLTVNQGQANLVLGLKPFGERPDAFTLLARYQTQARALYAETPEARVVFFGGGGPGGPGGGGSLNVALASAGQELLQERLEQAVAILQDDPYLLGVDIQGQNRLELNFIPDAARLAGTGLTPNQVVSTLQAFLQGTQAGQVELEGLTYPIRLRVDPTYVGDVQALLSLPLYSPSLGTNLAIGQLGHLVPEEVPSSIQRQNRLYVATLSLSPAPSAPPAAALLAHVEERLRAAGVLDERVALTEAGAFGQARLARELSGQGLGLFALAFFMAYLVMAAQFNTFRYPLYLLLPVPLALAGALLLLYLAGASLDIFGILGFLLLIGLSAKNAILYLDFVQDRLGRMPLEEALVEAARLRFRPILMTTLTILVIGLPLLLGHGAGAEFGRNLGLVILGGVFTSALLTFFVVPAAFYRYERVRVGGEAFKAEAT